MNRYPAFIDGEKGAYGVVFPDIPGACAMGETIDQALMNAESALRDVAEVATQRGETLPPPSAPEDVAIPDGATLVSVPLMMLSGRTVRANLALDEEALAYIDDVARRRGLTRTATVNWMARRMAQMGD